MIERGFQGRDGSKSEGLSDGEVRDALHSLDDTESDLSLR